MSKSMMVKRASLLLLLMYAVTAAGQSGQFVIIQSNDPSLAAGVVVDGNRKLSIASAPNTMMLTHLDLQQSHSVSWPKGKKAST